jgi:hypothetical protein
MYKANNRNYFVMIFVLAAVAAAFEIPLSAVKRGGAPPAVAGTEGRSIAEQRALLVHKTSIDSAAVPTPGVLGTYDESFSDDDIEWYRFELNPEAAQFIHLTPKGDGPVRVTMGWEDEASELDLRLTSPSYFGRPLTVNNAGIVTRGDNNQLMAERVDMDPTEVDQEITLQITGRDRELFRKSSFEVGPRKAFLLISGARLSDRMAAQQAFTTQMQEQYAQDRLDVEAYVEKHNIPLREELDGGGVREIAYIEDGKPVYFETYNLGAARTSHANKVWPGGGMGLSVTGTNIPPLGIWDAGPVNSRHVEFGNRVTVRDAGSPNSHGTHVGGTMVAAGVRSDAKGMSYEARLTSYDWGGAVSQMAREAANNGMLVSQHSYGSPGQFTYNRTAQSWDQMHLNYPFKIGSKSAGNDGDWWSIKDASNCKNNIVVGAIYEIRGGWSNPGSARITSFSSRGPIRSSNNRIKPDIVAKGSRLLSTAHDSNTGYRSMSGTSMSGPANAGMLGLMQDHYYSTHDRTYMRAATLKALTIHTAGESGTEGPDATYGWGVVHVQRAARLISDNDGGNAGLIQELTLSNGSTMDFNFSGSGDGEIMATIVWPDAAQATLDDDIDLRVSVDGTTAMPWRLNPNNPTGSALRGDNTVDNIERVNTGVNRAGADVSIEVSHKGSLSGGSQDFSLIVSGVSEGDPKTLNLLAPSEGDVVPAAGEYTIRWESEGEVGDIQIDWGHVGGQWSTVAESVSNDGSYTWSVPDTSHAECVVRITEVGGSLTDRSGYFEITQPPVIDVDNIEIDTSLRNNEEVYYDLDIGNTGRGVLQARISQTSAPSDLIDAASWSAATDEFGSEVDTAGGIIQDGSAIMGYTIVEQPDDNSWPWATMTAYLGKEFTGLESIEVSYSSDHEVSLALDQTGLTESGTSHRAVLPATGGIKDTVLSVPGDFAQPEWVSDETLLDLSEVQSASFSISPEYTSVTQGDLRVESISLEGVDLPITESPVSVDPDQLEVGGQSSETVRISLSAGEYETGEYHDTVVIRHNDPAADPIRIPVSLEIRENQNPEFDDVSTDYSLDPGDNFDIEVSAADPDGDGVSFTVNDLPDWLSVDEIESGVIGITGQSDDSHAETDYTFSIVAEDDFSPAGQSQLDISIKVGTDIVEIDTISGGSQTGIFPAQNPGQLSADSFEFSVLTGKPAAVRILIYDNLGNILDEQEKSGSTATGHVLSWDMRNVSGQKVGAGSYLIVAEVTYENGTGTSLRQMIGLRK